MWPWWFSLWSREKGEKWKSDSHQIWIIQIIQITVASLSHGLRGVNTGFAGSSPVSGLRWALRGRLRGVTRASRGQALFPVYGGPYADGFAGSHGLRGVKPCFRFTVGLTRTASRGQARTASRGQRLRGVTTASRGQRLRGVTTASRGQAPTASWGQALFPVYEGRFAGSCASRGQALFPVCGAEGATQSLDPGNVDRPKVPAMAGADEGQKSTTRWHNLAI